MPTNTSRPLAIKFTVLTGGIPIFAGLLLSAVTTQFSLSAVTFQFVIFVPLLFMLYRIYRRDNTARWIYSAIAFLIIVSSGYSFVLHSQPTTNTIATANEYTSVLSMVSALTLTVGVALLHIPVSRKWFLENDQNDA